MRRLQQAWLALIFLFGLGYIVLVPPFQSVDEVAHWDRVWTVARGQFNCKTLPNAAAHFVNFAFRFDNGSQQGPIPWSLFREAYEFSGGAGEFSIATAGCQYPPIGYLPAALVTALVTRSPTEPGPHKMFIAFYSGRLANWLFFFCCLVAAYRISLFPMPILAFASIPMVVHQAMSVNNDCVLFSGLLITCALVTRAPTRKRIWGAIALVALLSAIKPINAILSTLIWIGLWRAQRDGTKRREVWLLALASVALPLLAYQLWQLVVHVPILGLSTGSPVQNVNDAMQLEILRQTPTRVFSVLRWQLEEVFHEGPINGGWRGVFLALGWYRFTAPDYVYWLALASLLVGVVILRVDARGTFSQQRVPWLLVVSVIGSVLVYAAAVTLILYLAFTPVGLEMVFGVQGRYFLLPLGMLLFLRPLCALAPPRLVATAALAASTSALFLCTATNASALWAIRTLFWQM